MNIMINYDNLCRLQNETKASEFKRRKRKFRRSTRTRQDFRSSKQTIHESEQNLVSDVFHNFKSTTTSSFISIVYLHGILFRFHLYGTSTKYVLALKLHLALEKQLFFSIHFVTHS